MVANMSCDQLVQAVVEPVTGRVGACITGVPQRVIGSTVPPPAAPTGSRLGLLLSADDESPSWTSTTPVGLGAASSTAGPAGGSGLTSNTATVSLLWLETQSSPWSRRDVAGPGSAAVELGDRGERAARPSTSKHRMVSTPRLAT